MNLELTKILASKRGEIEWTEVGGRAQAPWRKELHHNFERALTGTKLPDRPDYEAANQFLIKTRKQASTL